MIQLACVLLAPFAFTLVAPIQEPYKLPPKEVVQLLDAPTIPSVRASPDARWLVTACMCIEYRQP